MFRDLEFQRRVFTALDAYLDALVAAKANDDKVAKVRAENPDINITVPDFPSDAWQVMRDANRLPQSRNDIPYSPRMDGIGQPVPNLTLKVPTGGGKTWLAVKSASMILNKYCASNTGFILWIVPNEAIYSQTLKHFRDRNHPYRLAFDRAAAGRVKILTKTDRLNATDIKTHLCVMVLMLQSANRKLKEPLKLFQDRGDVHGFIPFEGEQDAHRDMMARTPNLQAYQGFFPQVKSSLGNALRIIRPVVVMDEGHKAISDLAFDTLYGFNPCFMLELTATPKDKKPTAGQDARYANLLVEITGRELEREGMIKMPIILDTRQTEDWRTVLNASVDRLRALEAEAESFQSDTDRYIRPILLVQVERTGKEQRDSRFIHTEDVREYLLQQGFDDAELAIKTADQNDLKAPENQDLLSPLNRVKVILTKEALKEGWDCPFAYILCSLSSSSNLSSMTQLTGRILRQPHAEKTGKDVLDQCYVFTLRAATREVIQQVKKGLEKDGLGDLIISTTSDSPVQS